MIYCLRTCVCVRSNGWLNDQFINSLLIPIFWMPRNLIILTVKWVIIPDYDARVSCFSAFVETSESGASALLTSS